MRQQASGELHADFAVQPHGDEVHIWYVALTRATEVLSVPDKFATFVDNMHKLGATASRERALEDEFSTEQADGALAEDADESPQSAGTTLAPPSISVVLGKSPTERTFRPEDTSPSAHSCTIIGRLSR